MIRNHFEGVIAWAQTRQTNGFLEGGPEWAVPVCQAQNPSGYGRFRTVRTVIFLIAGKLDFSKMATLRKEIVVSFLRADVKEKIVFQWGFLAN